MVSISDQIKADQEKEDADYIAIATALLKDEQYGPAFTRASRILFAEDESIERLKEKLARAGKSPSNSTTLNRMYEGQYLAKNVLFSFIEVWLDAHPEYTVNGRSPKHAILVIISRMTGPLLQMIRWT